MTCPGFLCVKQPRCSYRSSGHAIGNLVLLSSGNASKWYCPSPEDNELHFCTSHLLTDDYYTNYLWHKQQDKTQNPKVLSLKPVTNHSHSTEQPQVSPAQREGCAGMTCSNTNQMSEHISPMLFVLPCWDHKEYFPLVLCKQLRALVSTYSFSIVRLLIET